MATSPRWDRNISVWRCHSPLWMGRQRPQALSRTYTQAPSILTATIPKQMVDRLGFRQCVPPTVTAICQIPRIKDTFLLRGDNATCSPAGILMSLLSLWSREGS